MAKVKAVALVGFVGEDRDDEGRKVRHARGEKVELSKPLADALLHRGRIAPPDSDAAKLALDEVKASKSSSSKSSKKKDD